MKTELSETEIRAIKEGVQRKYAQAAPPWRVECPPAFRLSAEIPPRPGRAG
jgi:hypothetical protein